MNTYKEKEEAFLISGPSSSVVVFTRDMIEPLISSLVVKEGHDNEDYTATKIHIRITIANV